MHIRIMNTISFILKTSLPDPYHALHMTDLYLSGKIQLKFSAISKTLSGSVKLTPKDFSDYYPVKGLLWFSQIDSKISLVLIPVEDIQRLSSGSVKSILRFF